MNQTLKEIQELVKGITDMRERESIVDNYFFQLVWSSEKSEWEHMTTKERDSFVTALHSIKESG